MMVIQTIRWAVYMFVSAYFMMNSDADLDGSISDAMSMGNIISHKMQMRQE